MRFCGVGVLGCCSRKGERESEAGGLRVEAEDEMPKFKIQMTNDGGRNTSPSTKYKYTDTFDEHGHEL